MTKVQAGLVERSLEKTDLSLAIGQWLASPRNNTQVVQLIQQTVPKVFEFVSQEQIANFVQNNSVQWVRNTQVNKLASEMLRAVLEMISTKMYCNVVSISRMSGWYKIRIKLAN
ncbi:hypothetical protein [Staphylococcus aureus]|uniref:hypothetical protein n=1 Tax=Staphylococcus aureus TaxID=1280 RepID=UPI001C831228